MTAISLLLLATSLAVDATAMAAARGMALQTLSLRGVLAVSAVFGGFHGVMPTVGWVAGDALGGVLHGAQPWLAFGVLTLVGGKMAWDGISGSQRDATADVSFGALMPVGFATSLDAAAAGVALPALNAPLLASVVLIGVVTALFSGAGVVLGLRLRAFLGPRADVLGGMVVMGFGLVRLVH